MKKLIKNILNFLKKFNDKVDKAEDGAEKIVEKTKESNLSKNVKKFFNKEGIRKTFTVISWIIFAMIIYLSITFIGHPLTFCLFLILAILIMPTFNNYLRKKEIKIANWKKVILFISVFIITILTAPIDENGNLYKGIEGIDFKLSNNNSVILNNEDIKVVPYAVNYYYDNVLVSSEQYEANLYDVITFYEDGSQNGRYELVTENNFPLEINSENLKDNIINIYYKTKREKTEESSETLETNTTETQKVPIEETVENEEIEWSAQTIQSSTYEEVKDMLNKEVDSSTKNVVYTVEYIYDGEIDDSLTDYFIVPIGSRVEACNQKDKEGYTYKETENCPIEVNDNKQVIKVKYTLN